MLTCVIPSDVILIPVQQSDVILIPVQQSDEKRSRVMMTDVMLICARSDGKLIAVV